MFKTMGYSPGFLLKIGRFRNLSNSPQIFTNNLESSYKYICKQIGGVSGSLERFSIPTQNPPCSKPWAIAQAFCSKSVDFGPFRIHPNLAPKISKVVKNLFSSKQEAFQGVWNDFRHLPKSAMFKTMGYSPGFLLKIGRFRTLSNSPQIFTNNLESSQKSICKHIVDVSGSLERFSAPTQIRHVQNHGLQPRLFAQNRSISDPFEFTPNLHQQSRKQLQIYLQANRRRFRKFGTIFDTYPKSAMFKTMGYSPGFLLKIGRFRTLSNSPQIFTNNLESS